VPEQLITHQLSVLARDLASQPNEADTVTRTVDLAADLLACAAVDVVKNSPPDSIFVVATTDSVRSTATHHITEVPDITDVASGSAVVCRSLDWPSIPPSTSATLDGHRLEHQDVLQGNGYVLRFHGGDSGRWTLHDLQIATAFADIAAIAIDRAVYQDQARSLAVGLESNRVIGTAIGIIMIGSRVTYEHAFAALKDRSQRTNRKLRQIADEVILTGALPARADAGAA
jgi:hypothetical protein